MFGGRGSRFWFVLLVDSWEKAWQVNMAVTLHSCKTIGGGSIPGSLPRLTTKLCLHGQSGQSCDTHTHIISYIYCTYVVICMLLHMYVFIFMFIYIYIYTLHYGAAALSTRNYIPIFIHITYTIYTLYTYIYIRIITYYTLNIELWFSGMLDWPKFSIQCRRLNGLLPRSRRAGSQFMAQGWMMDHSIAYHGFIITLLLFLQVTVFWLEFERTSSDIQIWSKLWLWCNDKC